MIPWGGVSLHFTTFTFSSSSTKFSCCGESNTFMSSQPRASIHHLCHANPERTRRLTLLHFHFSLPRTKTHCSLFRRKHKEQFPKFMAWRLLVLTWYYWLTLNLLFNFPFQGKMLKK
jgi:hypothetical protein